jgi:hypothetical protein
MMEETTERAIKKHVMLRHVPKGFNKEPGKTSYRTREEIGYQPNI